MRPSLLTSLLIRLGRGLAAGLLLALLALALGLLLSAAATGVGPGASLPPPLARTSAGPRWVPDSATVQVAAGPQYAAGWGWQLLWGRHHRRLWATPVTARVLRLGPGTPGGLRPVQAGGSYQSRTLRLRADDGREFVLRSVDKDARAALPAGWPRRLLGGLMRDQTSAGHPYAAYPAARLAEAAGVLHTNPQLVFVGDEAGLGQFRARYANALYLLEERPDGDQRHAPSLGFAPRVISSSHLRARLGQQPAPSPATARAFLRARLLDLWLGDWSRRPDQWRWAVFPTAQGNTRPEYRPIPRDRDQAFFQLGDGLYPGLISLCVAKYQSLTPALTPRRVAGLRRSARALDLLLLRGLARADFQAEADSLRRRLTDEALAQALQAGPPEVRAQMSADLTPVLRARRAQLPAVAGWFFEQLQADKEPVPEAVWRD
ncbi:hypothetical protein [uncultured Hymenobacter sp.]|uniref:hypothetical protein n=1 Tax=uncultured Hymenobacter sp. TaxID=170016 RepID=UPI0035C94DE1